MRLVSFGLAVDIACGLHELGKLACHHVDAELFGPIDPAFIASWHDWRSFIGTPQVKNRQWASLKSGSPRKAKDVTTSWLPPIDTYPKTGQGKVQ